MCKQFLSLKQVIFYIIHEEFNIKKLIFPQFMLRQQVLMQYRDVLRTIKRIPNEEYRRELLEWARRDFRDNAHHTDEITIKMLLNHGNRSLRELKTTMDLSK